jgi:ACS family hexuronate transporter-like MFS transporter
VALGFLHHRRGRIAVDALVDARLFPARTTSQADRRRTRLHSLEHEQSGAPRESKVPLLELLRFRETWGVVFAKFLSDAAWYFYMFWLPKYLLDARGFNIKAVGSVAWIPFAAAALGCLVGGGLSSWLLHRGRSVNAARKIALGLSAAVMPCVMLVPHVPSRGASCFSASRSSASNPGPRS